MALGLRFTYEDVGATIVRFVFQTRTDSFSVVADWYENMSICVDISIINMSLFIALFY